MSDMIERQVVIDEIKSHYRMHDNDLLELIVYKIENLPSVQPEWKKGKWIRPKRVPDSVLRECSICGFDTGAGSFNFCPNCGCYIGGKQE